MDQGTCFSNSAIAIITALLTALVGALSLLFRELLKVQTQRIEYLETQLDRALSVSEGQNEVAKDLVQTTKRGQRLPR